MMNVLATESHEGVMYHSIIYEVNILASIAREVKFDPFSSLWPSLLKS